MSFFVKLICGSLSPLLFCFSGTPSDIHRLMMLAPKVNALKVNLGRWSLKAEDPGALRMPKKEMLLKAALWESEEFHWLREILKSPPMKVEQAVTGDSVKLDTSAGSTLHILKNSSGMEKSLSLLPFGMCVIDARSMSVEDAEVITSAPGRSRFLDVPVFIIGGVAETEVMKAAVLKACGSEWTGEHRFIDVFTSEGTTQYLAARRRLLMLLPQGAQGKKLPPFLNIVEAPSPTLGWVACLGLVRHLWKEGKRRAEDGNIEWLYCLSEDLQLPVLLTQRIDSHPSVVFCSLQSSLTVIDTAAKVTDGLKTAQDSPVLPWGQLFQREQYLEAFFDRGVDASDDDSGGSSDRGRTDSPPHRGQKASKARRQSESPMFYWESPSAKKIKGDEEPKSKEKDKPESKSKDKREKGGRKEKEPKAKKTKADAAESSSSKADKEKGKKSCATDLSRRLGSGLSKPSTS